MNRFTEFVAVTTLSTDPLSHGAVQAMEIQKFDKLADADQDEYVADLVAGARQVLRVDGRADLAEQVHKLFAEVLTGDAMFVGMVEFEGNLARARMADLERSDKHNGAPRLEVEHAMIVTLKKNGIALPQSFMHVMDGFRPKQPMQ